MPSSLRYGGWLMVEGVARSPAERRHERRRGPLQIGKGRGGTRDREGRGSGGGADGGEGRGWCGEARQRRGREGLARRTGGVSVKTGREKKVEDDSSQFKSRSLKW